MSAELDRIQASIINLQEEKSAAERDRKKYESVISRLDDLLFSKSWFSDNRVSYRLQYITEHYTGFNGVYDRLERNPDSVEGKFARLFADREQMNRRACARNLSAFQDAYMSVVRQYETAIQRRDECWRIVQEKDSAIRQQQMELAQQREREQRIREEQARRAVEEAAKRAAEEAARRVEEQQKAAQAFAHLSTTTGRAGRRR